VAKRKSNRRRRAGGQRGRARDPAAGVGRAVRLDDLLLPRTATGDVAPAAVPIAAPPEQQQRRLAPVPDVEPDSPHVRLGAAWAVATFVVAGLGVVAIAVWYAAAAGLAALQASRSWRKRPREPVPEFAAAGAAVIPLAAAVSVPVFAGAVVAVAIAALFWRPDPRRSAPALTVLVALSFGLAAAAPVIARRMGLVEVIVLLSFVGVYDASAFLVGTGATRWWEGPAAGVAFIFAVTLAAAAIFVPPFDGASPWLLGALAAGLAPLGPIGARRLLGDTRARAPAVRRLDSLLVLGPLWTAAAYVLL
jgi:hypothetical protein